MKTRKARIKEIKVGRRKYYKAQIELKFLCFSFWSSPTVYYYSGSFFRFFGDKDFSLLSAKETLKQYSELANEELEILND